MMDSAMLSGFGQRRGAIGELAVGTSVFKFVG
jgi:hypothetical protein